MIDLCSKLNEIASKLYFEDMFGPPKFTEATEAEGRWTLGFRSRRGAGKVTVRSDRAPLDATGALDPTWLESLKDAIFDWESAHMG